LGGTAYLSSPLPDVALATPLTEVSCPYSYTFPAYDGLGRIAGGIDSAAAVILISKRLTAYSTHAGNTTILCPEVDWDGDEYGNAQFTSNGYIIEARGCNLNAPDDGLWIEVRVDYNDYNGNSVVDSAGLPTVVAEQVFIKSENEAPYN
jgi:hypothetical protein